MPLKKTKDATIVTSFMVVISFTYLYVLALKNFFKNPNIHFIYWKTSYQFIWLIFEFPSFWELFSENWYKYSILPYCTKYTDFSETNFWALYCYIWKQHFSLFEKKLWFETNFPGTGSLMIHQTWWTHVASLREVMKVQGHMKQHQLCCKKIMSLCGSRAILGQETRGDNFATLSRSLEGWGTQHYSLGCRQKSDTWTQYRVLSNVALSQTTLTLKHGFIIIILLTKPSMVETLPTQTSLTSGQSKC